MSRLDPDAPRAEITQTRWSGTFTPDLIVSGRLEGRGLTSGVLIIKDSSGGEIHRVEASINEAIKSATSRIPRDGLATVSLRVRIDDDDLAEGSNTIVLRVTDRRGRTSETETKVTKRLF